MRNPQVRNSKSDVPLYKPAFLFSLVGTSFSFPGDLLNSKGGVTLKQVPFCLQNPLFYGLSA